MILDYITAVNEVRALYSPWSHIVDIVTGVGTYYCIRIAIRAWRWYTVDRFLDDE